jgi:UDP-2,4-diacetamido-2,4,6-trideoxy-beta-L-altropyranose hydrolase
MNVYIRADASVEIGTGHVMRCLTLAEKLREYNAQVEFICREHKGNLIEWIRNHKGFSVHALPVNKNAQDVESVKKHYGLLETTCRNDAEQTAAIFKQSDKEIDWLVLDHYALDIRWENSITPFVKKLMVIDDLANRKHNCDLLLDQNLNFEENRYKELVPEDCVFLLGPKYALLRKEFLIARNKLRKRNAKIQRIIVSFGGSDPTNETEKALEAIRLLKRSDIKTDVVIGLANPKRTNLENVLETVQNTKLFVQVDNIAELFSNADLAIGAGGSTTWERCCLGLPCIIISTAENQLAIAKNACNSGLGVNLGYYKNCDSYQILQRLDNLINNPLEMQKMSAKSMVKVDGNGVERVINQMIAY